MRFWIAALAACLALGCSTVDDTLAHRDDLEEAQKRYTQLIRWRDAERAARFVVPERRESFMELAKNLELIEISDYELGEFQFGDDDKTASIEVTYRGYMLNQLVERKIHVTQKWRRNDGEQWMIDPDLEYVVSELQKP
jgi:hypothetical protein